MDGTRMRECNLQSERLQTSVTNTQRRNSTAVEWVRWVWGDDRRADRGTSTSTGGNNVLSAQIRLNKNKHTINNYWFSYKLRQTPQRLNPYLCLYKTLPKEVCTNSEALVQIKNQVQTDQTCVQSDFKHPNRKRRTSNPVNRSDPIGRFQTASSNEERPTLIWSDQRDWSQRWTALESAGFTLTGRAGGGPSPRGPRGQRRSHPTQTPGWPLAALVERILFETLL